MVENRKSYPSNEEIKARLLEKIEIDHNRGCWIWTASVGSPGYGQLSICGKPETAHRLSYRIFRGDIPPGLFIDHLCRNRRCINPYHLEAVTHQVNMARGQGGPAHARRMMERTHCKKGHLLDVENIRGAEQGKKQCLTCYRVGIKERNDRKPRKPPESRKPNVADIGRTKTHCPKGHSYSGDNVYVYRGSRYCRECQREFGREYMRKRRAMQKLSTVCSGTEEKACSFRIDAIRQIKT
jgi:hypothetical protein